MSSWLNDLVSNVKEKVVATATVAATTAAAKLGDNSNNNNNCSNNSEGRQHVGSGDGGTGGAAAAAAAAAARRNRRRHRPTIPSNLDLQYITDTLMVGSQPIPASNPSFTDTGSDNNKEKSKRTVQQLPPPPPHQHHGGGNSPAALSSFLEKKGGNDDDVEYLLFNVSDTIPDDRTLVLLRRKIVNLPLRSIQNCETPIISSMLDICYALKAWLESEEDDDDGDDDDRRRKRRIAIVYCSNGRTRTALVVACYLKFTKKVDTTSDGFCHFVDVTRRQQLSRQGQNNLWHNLLTGIASASTTEKQQQQQSHHQNHHMDPETLLQFLPASLHTFFQNWDRLIDLGSFINSSSNLQSQSQASPLLLRAITLQGVPVEDKPCIDIYEYVGDDNNESGSGVGGENQRQMRGKLVYSSHRKRKKKKLHGDDTNNNNDTHTVEEHIEIDQTSQWADEEGFYNVNVVLKGDFLLLCRFGTTDTTSSDNVLYEDYVDDYDNDDNSNSSRTSSNNETAVILRYANHIGFLGSAGYYELPITRVDVMRQFSQFFDGDFLLTLVFESYWDTTTVYDSIRNELKLSQHQQQRPDVDTINSSSSSSSSFVLRGWEASERGWHVIVSHHAAQPTDVDVDRMLQFSSSQKLRLCRGVSSCPRHLISLALQLHNYDYRMAEQELLCGMLSTWWRINEVGDAAEETEGPSQQEVMLIEDDEEKGCEVLRDDGRVAEESTLGSSGGITSAGGDNYDEVQQQNSKKRGCTSPSDVAADIEERDENENDRTRQTVLDILSEVDHDIMSNIHPADIEAGGLDRYQNNFETPPRQSEASNHIPLPCVSAIVTPHSGDVMNAFGVAPVAPADGGSSSASSAAAGRRSNNNNPLGYIGPHRPLTMRSTPMVPLVPRTQASTMPLPLPPIDDPKNAAAMELLMKLHHSGVTLQDLLDLANASQHWNKREALCSQQQQQANQSTTTSEQQLVVEEKKNDEPLKSEQQAQSLREGPEVGDSPGGEENKQGKAGDDLPLKDNPKYEKYFRMLSKGLPDGAVRNALQRDGHDPSILDLDPEKSLASQQTKTDDKGDTEPALKHDPKYEKYFRMLSKGLPDGAVRNALQRDGHDPSILNLDPEKSLASQIKTKPTEGDTEPVLKEDPKYEKYFRMLKTGLPEGAVRNALIRDGLDAGILDLDPEKSLSSQTKSGEDDDDGPALKDDPKFKKYFHMLRTGLPEGAVRNALIRDGLDPSILDLDPEKSHAPQTKTDGADTGPPLKEDPKYEKYFRMLKTGLPVGAVHNALLRDGLEPSVLDLDPEKSLASQTKATAASHHSGAGTPLKQALRPRQSIMKKKKRVRRKKIYWNPIDPNQIKEDSLWSIVKGKVEMSRLKYDVKEFEDLFTQSTETSDQKKKKAQIPAKKVKKAVQVIDGKRSMNGGIVLVRLKMDYKKIADMVETMETGDLDSTQLMALKEFLPTLEEKKGLLAYMERASTSDESKRSAYADLSECEKYMFAMLDVEDAAEKFDCMLFRVQFFPRLDEIVDAVKIVEKACEEVRSSEKLRHIMAMILTLVNEINTGGDGNDAAFGFSLDALLKLNEAKAFDRKTSVLHYLVKIVMSNDDGGLCDFGKDLVHMKEAETVVLDSLISDMQTLEEELTSVKETAKKQADEYEKEGKVEKVKLKELREQRTSIRNIQSIPQYNKIDHLTGRTVMERFTINAERSIDDAKSLVLRVQSNYAKVLEYLCEDEKMASNDFFGTMRSFVVEFNRAAEQVIREDKAKRREEKKHNSSKSSSQSKKDSIEQNKAALSVNTSFAAAEATEKSSGKVDEAEVATTNSPSTMTTADATTVDSTGGIAASAFGIAAMAAAAAASKQKAPRRSPTNKEKPSSDSPPSIAAMAAAAAAAKKTAGSSPPKGNTSSPSGFVEMAAIAASRKKNSDISAAAMTVSAIIEKAPSSPEKGEDSSLMSSPAASIAAMATAAANKKKRSDSPKKVQESSSSSFMPATSIVAMAAAAAAAPNKRTEPSQEKGIEEVESPSSSGADAKAPSTPVVEAATTTTTTTTTSIAAMAAAAAANRKKSPISSTTNKEDADGARI